MKIAFPWPVFTVCVQIPHELCTEKLEERVRRKLRMNKERRVKCGLINYFG